MKFILLFILALFTFQLFGVNNKNTSIKFMQHINAEYIFSYNMSYDVENETKYKVLPYYEFEDPKLTKGKAILFAINKEVDDSWISKCIDSPRNSCIGNGVSSNIYYINCEIKSLFTIDTVSLFRDFELFIFFVDLEDLDEPFYEQSEGDVITNYFAKEGSSVKVFKRENSNWILYSSESLKHGSIKITGIRFMEKYFQVNYLQDHSSR